jgi:hypothetical protein
MEPPPGYKSMLLSLWLDGDWHTLDIPTGQEDSWTAYLRGQATRRKRHLESSTTRTSITFRALKVGQI